MKKLFIIILIISILLLLGCQNPNDNYDIVASTLPVYDFAVKLCEGTGLSVGRLVSENISCLHDYTMQVSQMQMIEHADAVIISGAGLESFMEDALADCRYVIDASEGVHLHSGDHHHHDHDVHNHNTDPHIWLSPENAAIMSGNICTSLCKLYPQYEELFLQNLDALLVSLMDLQNYGQTQLNSLSFTDLITFHDGFGYLAESFQLTILEAVEEESGSEASAAEVIHLIELVNSHNLPAVFIETNGSNACARIISAETGAKIYVLDMAMAGESYFDAMYHNINTIKEALK